MANVDKIISDIIEGAQRAGARIEVKEKHGHEVKLANLEALLGGAPGAMPPGMPPSGGGMPPGAPAPGGLDVNNLPPEVVALLEQLCGQMQGGGGAGAMPPSGGPPSEAPPFGGEAPAGADASPFPPKKSDKSEKKKDDKKDDKAEEKEAALNLAYLHGIESAGRRFKVAFLGPLLGMGARIAGGPLASAGMSRLGGMAAKSGMAGTANMLGRGAKFLGGSGVGSQMAQAGVGELGGQAVDRMFG